VPPRIAGVGMRSGNRSIFSKQASKWRLGDEDKMREKTRRA
jgi:hypothetical protein